MNELFDYLVVLLERAALALDTTYVAVNIWLFVIIEPIVFVAVLYMAIHYWKKYRLLSKELI